MRVRPPIGVWAVVIAAAVLALPVGEQSACVLHTTANGEAGALRAVSVSRVTGAWAVGSGVARWVDERWAPQALPAHRGRLELVDVVARGPTVWVVGSDGTEGKRAPYVARWTVGRWWVVPAARLASVRLSAVTLTTDGTARLFGVERRGAVERYVVLAERGPRLMRERIGQDTTGTGLAVWDADAPGLTTGWFVGEESCGPGCSRATAFTLTQLGWVRVETPRAWGDVIPLGATACDEAPAPLGLAAVRMLGRRDVLVGGWTACGGTAVRWNGSWRALLLPEAVVSVTAMAHDASSSTPLALAESPTGSILLRPTGAGWTTALRTDDTLSDVARASDGLVWAVGRETTVVGSCPTARG